MATVASGRPKVRRKPSGERLPDSPDPVEIAMATVASGKALPDIARRVLEEQARLIAAQCAELRFRRVGEIVRAALWAILATIALAMLALIAALVVRAMRSDALVVESFRVPPALSVRGLTGEVVATQVLDKLAEMQASSESTRAASSYANNWGDELKIDIPQTGASADQIWKLMRGWLGKETRISGEVVSMDGGLALTARVGTSPGQRFGDPDGDLDALITKAAALIYRETQPYRYTIYASRQPGGEAESHALLKQLTGHPSELERKWAYNGLSVDYRAMGEFERSAEMARKALAIDPDMIPALGNLSTVASMMGHDQEVVDLLQRQHRIPVAAEYDPAIVEANKCRTQRTLAWIVRDVAAAQTSLRCFDKNDGVSGSSDPVALFTVALLGHDLPRAMSALIVARSPSDSAEEVAVDTAYMHLAAAVQDGDRARVAAALRQFDSAHARVLAPAFPAAALYRTGAPTNALPLRAEALIRLGRIGDSAALIARTPLDCYTCVRVRGFVARAQGDAVGAHRWFEEAIRQAPRLAPAYVDLGRLLLAARRPATAAARFEQAAELAPNWADPQKYWGDALVAEGRGAEAIAKYDSALRLAPAWPELRRARSAVKRTG